MMRISRTLRKGLVELAVALAVTALGWFIDSAAGLGIGPEYLAIVIPLALTGRRMLRDQTVDTEDPPA